MGLQQERATHLPADLELVVSKESLQHHEGNECDGSKDDDNGATAKDQCCNIVVVSLAHRERNQCELVRLLECPNLAGDCLMSASYLSGSLILFISLRGLLTTLCCTSVAR